MPFWFKSFWIRKNLRIIMDGINGYLYNCIFRYNYVLVSKFLLANSLKFDFRIMESKNMFDKLEKSLPFSKSESNSKKKFFSSSDTSKKYSDFMSDPERGGTAWQL